MSSDPSLDDAVPSPEGTEAPAPLEADDSTALLAELDVLLERMMALPVNQLDEESVPGQPRTEQPPDDLPLITITQAMPGSIDTSSLPSPVTSTSDDLYVQTLLHEHQPEPPAPPSLPSPPSRAPEPVAVWNSPPSEEGPNEEPAFTAPPVLPLPDLAPQPADMAAPQLRPPRWLGPLLWCNRSFDRVATRLGFAGLWVQQPRGRMLLGWAGFLMVAAVCGLALGDCLGWTW